MNQTEPAVKPVEGQLQSLHWTGGTFVVYRIENSLARVLRVRIAGICWVQEKIKKSGNISQLC